jgi:hypothetical protein
MDERTTNRKRPLLERAESLLTVVGPLAIGVAAAGYGAAAGKMTVMGALTVGFALWQLSMIAVVAWNVAAGPSRSG